MMLLARFFNTIVSPLGVVLLLGAFAVLAAIRQRRRLAVWSGSMALIGLWIFSLPIISETILSRLEAAAGPREIDALPTAEVVVLLGGGVRGAQPPSRPFPDMVASADRVWHAARLYHAGKAPLILAVGGVARPGEAPEAVAMHQLLLDLGVPDSAILLEDRSRNTLENVRNVESLLAARHVGRVLLVTSALHMRRALKLFQDKRFEVLAAPTDFEADSSSGGLERWLPDAKGLASNTRAFKEVLGAWLGH